MPSGNITLSPGYTFSDEAVTLDKLNDLGNPTARIDEGAITAREMADDAFDGAHFQDDSIALEKITASDTTEGAIPRSRSGVWVAEAFPTSVAIPAGAILPYGGVSAPTGYLLCNGAQVDRTTYADLFAVIGDDYGAGDGTSTFNVPDFRGMFPWGKKTATDLGDTGGAETHTLTTDELPAHSHDKTVTRGADDNTSGSYIQSSNTSSSTVLIDTADAGGGQAHNNLPPYLVVNFIIKT